MKSTLFHPLRFISIDRPFVFLCGPALSEPLSDRRRILQQYIDGPHGHRGDMRLLPIIVDPFFKQEEIAKGSYSLPLLEEIMAAVAFRTYIFLDTISTSYELGLFTNHYSKDAVNVFVDEGYEQRLLTPVGGFVKNSIQDKKTSYKAYYSERGYILFPKNKVPSSIAKVIENDLAIAYRESSPVSTKFLHESLDDLPFNSFGSNYDPSLNLLTLRCSVKTLFYWVMRLRANKTSAVDEFTIYSQLKTILFESYLVCSPWSPFTDQFLFKSPEISLSVQSFEIVSLIRHCLFVCQKLLTNTDGDETSKYIPYTENTFSSNFAFLSVNLERLLEISPSDVRLATAYANNPNAFVTVRAMTIRGKSRQIVSYAPNRKGKELAAFHRRFVSKLQELIPSSSASFAYNKGRNCKQCLELHLRSRSFARTDIHAFFDSITKNAMFNTLLSVLDRSYLRAAFLKTTKNVHPILRSVLGACFYHRRLPIGFISSPCLSEIYMSFIDTSMTATAQANGLVYTRYADDVLISCNELDKAKIKKALADFTSFCSLKALVLNDKKTLIKLLQHENDSIKFLGLSLVYRGASPSSITVPAKYLQLIWKKFALALKNHDIDGLTKAVAQANYVRFNSAQSFHRLCISVKKKTHRNLFRFCTSPFKKGDCGHFPAFLD
jgi:hypothetical protein